MLIYRTHAENLLSLSFLYIVRGLVSIELIWLQPFTINYKINVKGYSRIDSIGRCLHAVYIDLKDLSIKGWTVSVTVVFRGGKAI